MKKLLNKDKKEISAERAVLTSFFVDLTDIIANAIVALITGSVVMIAETIQGIVDALSVGIVFIGLKFSKKPADKKHPFGYGKAVYFWTFLAGILIFGITAITIFYMGLQRFLNPEKIQHIYLTFIILSFFILTNGYSLSVGIRRILKGKKLKHFFKMYRTSQLVETKTTITLDLIGSSAAIIGLIALILYQTTGNMRFDGLGAMAIGVILGGLALFLLNNTKNLLIGKSAPPETEEKIKEIVLGIKNVIEILDLKTMNIGLGKILVNIEIHVEEDLKTKQIEKLIDKIRIQIRKNIKEVKHIQIELETPESELNQNSTTQK